MIDPADYSQEYTEHCAEIVEIQRLTAELAAARAEVERLRELLKDMPGLGTICARVFVDPEANVRSAEWLAKRRELLFGETIETINKHLGEA